MPQKIVFFTLLLSSALCPIYAMESAQQEKCPICWVDKPITEFVYPSCCNSKQAICIACYQEILERDNFCPFCRSGNCSLEKKKHVRPQEPFQRPPSLSFSEKILDICLLQ